MIPGEKTSLSEYDASRMAYEVLAGPAEPPAPPLYKGINGASVAEGSGVVVSSSDDGGDDSFVSPLDDSRRLCAEEESTRRKRAFSAGTMTITERWVHLAYNIFIRAGKLHQNFRFSII